MVFCVLHPMFSPDTIELVVSCAASRSHPEAGRPASNVGADCRHVWALKDGADTVGGLVRVDVVDLQGAPTAAVSFRHRLELGSLPLGRAWLDAGCADINLKGRLSTMRSHVMATLGTQDSLLTWLRLRIPPKMLRTLAAARTHECLTTTRQHEQPNTKCMRDDSLSLAVTILQRPSHPSPGVAIMNPIRPLPSGFVRNCRQRQLLYSGHHHCRVSRQHCRPLALPHIAGHLCCDYRCAINTPWWSQASVKCDAQ